MNSNKKNTLPKVSIVLLNWNGIDDTIMCLESLRKLNYPNYEIIVVDNGSSDDSISRLENEKNIKLLKSSKNRGFTGGHILGAKHSNGQYIALINNDLVVDKNWLINIVEACLERDADIAGGRSYIWDEAHPKMSTDNPFYSYQVVNPVTAHTLSVMTGNSLREVNSISGSNLLVSKKIINKIGYLDKTFFAYYEETDLIARVKRCGKKVIYVPNAHVWHKIAASTSDNPYFYFYQMHRNRFLFATRNFDRKYLFKFWAYYNLEFVKSLKHYYKDKSALYDKAMIHAWLYNILHFVKTLMQRSKIMRLGGSYSDKILSNKDVNQTVTISIPCYNYEKYVEKAIISASNQTSQPAKILIIDDCSTDNSVSIIKNTIKKLSSSHPDIDFELVCHEKNLGIVKTKNQAIDTIDTEWHVFLDADDILESNYLEKLLYEARSKNADVVYTDMRFIGATNGIHKVAKYNKYILRYTNIIHNSALMKSILLKTVNGYKEEMSGGYEDWELNIRISKLKPRYAYVSEPLLQYRRHEGASRDSSAQIKLPETVKKLEKLHPDLYNFRYYMWIETARAKEALKTLFKFPFYSLRHMKSHLNKKYKESSD